MSQPMRQELIFLKLGGSLITDKNTPGAANSVLIERLANEIAQVVSWNPSLKLLLGHGSGSFGHVAADQYGTWEGVSTAEEWRGFAEVWFQARALNRLLMTQFHQAGLPALAFPASSGAVVEDRKITRWELEPLQAALGHNLIPVVYG
ncbi:MAG: hypothetical protein PVI99_09960, partial [Anaerolineales bacterium]